MLYVTINYSLYIVALPLLFISVKCLTQADPNGRAVYGVGLRPLACWNCGFRIQPVHECLSLVIVVCCELEVSATGADPSPRGVLPIAIGPVIVVGCHNNPLPLQ